jgi:hypothetical protein
MLSLYALLGNFPPETSDPHTKERYGLVPLVLHVLMQVVAGVLELLMIFVAIDVVTDELIPAEIKNELVTYLAGGLAVMIPSICLLISGLIYSGLLVER